MDSFAFKVARYRELARVDRCELAAFIEQNAWDEKFMAFVSVKNAISEGLADAMRARRSVGSTDRVATPSELKHALEGGTMV